MQSFEQFLASRRQVASIADMEEAEAAGYLGGGGEAHVYDLPADFDGYCYVETLPDGRYAFWAEHEGRWSDFYYPTLAAAERALYAANHEA